LPPLIQGFIQLGNDLDESSRIFILRCLLAELPPEQLTGHWREDHLFSLQQALKMYDAVQERIAAYEKEILRKLGDMEREQQRGQTAPPLQNANKTKAIKKRGQEPKRQA
jgi:hypothetical protein